MIESKGVHAYRIVVIHQARLARDDIKDEFLAPIAAKVVHHLSELLGTIFENVHRHTARFIHKRQCGEQSRQPEAVVAMQMRNEYVGQPRQFQPPAAHLKLCALAAIYHHQIVAHVEHLTRWQMTQRRLCRTTSQDIQFQFIHKKFYFTSQ